MNYYRRSVSSRPSPFGGAFTPGVKMLLIVNIVIFFLQRFTGLDEWIKQYFALNYHQVLNGSRYWQVFTYMFLHGSFLHIFFNLLFLFFFGAELEREWGKKRFLKYYFFTGIGAGFFILLVDWVSIFYFNQNIAPTTLGASGAILGILVAYALYFPERQITLLLFFILPITLKAKHFAIGYGVIELFSLFSSSKSGVSHAGHIGGMLSGIIFFLLNQKKQVYRVPNHSLRRFFGSVKEFFGLPSSQVYERSQIFKEKKSFFTGELFKKKKLDLDEKKMTDKQIEETIDVLLEIISQKGLNALKVEEQLFLDRVSKLYRHKFPD